MVMLGVGEEMCRDSSWSARMRSDDAVCCCDKDEGAGNAEDVGSLPVSDGGSNVGNRLAAWFIPEPAGASNVPGDGESEVQPTPSIPCGIVHPASGASLSRVSSRGSLSPVPENVLAASLENETCCSLKSGLDVPVPEFAPVSRNGFPGSGSCSLPRSAARGSVSRVALAVGCGLLVLADPPGTATCVGFTRCGFRSMKSVHCVGLWAGGGSNAATLHPPTPGSGDDDGPSPRVRSVVAISIISSSIGRNLVVVVFWVR
jgi:hypothetical protein